MLLTQKSLKKHKGNNFKPGQDFDDFLWNFRVIIEEVLDVVSEQEEHVGSDLSHGLVVEPERCQQNLKSGQKFQNLQEESTGIKTGDVFTILGLYLQ
jgi:hypothetical protein